MSDAELNQFCTIMSQAADLSQIDPQAGHDAAIDCIKVFLTTLDDGRYLDLCMMLSRVKGMYAPQFDN